MSILLQNHLGGAAPCSRHFIKSIVTMESVDYSLASHHDLSRWHQHVPLWFLRLSMAKAFFTGIITATATSPFLHSRKQSEMCLSKYFCWPHSWVKHMLWPYSLLWYSGVWIFQNVYPLNIWNTNREQIIIHSGMYCKSGSLTLAFYCRATGSLLGDFICIDRCSGTGAVFFFHLSLYCFLLILLLNT